jgi:hypothetical protein
MNLRRVRVTVCGEPLDLRIFHPEERAAEHLRKHVLDPGERWETIVPRPALAAAARDPEGPPLEALYDPYADEIEAGLRFAARLPCHLHGVQPAGTEEPPRFLGFLSRRGVRIFADRTRVRTAYRTPLRRDGHSDYAFFARAWFDFLTRGADRRCVGPAGAGAALPPNIVQWRGLGAAAP